MIEIEDYQEDHDEESPDESDADEYHCCLGCMECLGFTWRDFM